MTTSGTSTYSQSVAQIVSGSMRLCGIIGDEETPTGAQMVNALDSFNAMIKGWSAAGINVWCENECILFLQPGQPQYSFGPASTDNACLFEDLTQTTLSATASAGASSITVTNASGLSVGDNIGVQLDAGTNYWTTIAGAIASNVVPIAGTLPSQATSGAIAFDYTTPLYRPMRVPEGRRYIYSSQIENPLLTLSRFDYDYLPNKYNTGAVTQFFYDPQTGNGAYSSANGLMNVWPSPSDNQSGLRFVAQRMVQDIVSVANTLDFPSEWLPALRWNLAREIAMEYDVPADRFDRIDKMSGEWYLRVQAWNKEPESILMGYATTQGYRT